MTPAKLSLDGKAYFFNNSANSTEHGGGEDLGVSQSTVSIVGVGVEIDIVSECSSQMKMYITVS